MKKIFYSLSLLLMTAMCISFTSCGNDDDAVLDPTEIVHDSPETTVTPTTAELLGKWKILQIGNVDWQTLSYSEDEGYIVFEKDGTFTTRKGGYHLLNATEVSRFAIDGKNVNVFSQGANIGTFTFIELNGNTAKATLMLNGEAKNLVLEKQPTTRINIYEATLDLPEGLLGGGDLYLNDPVSSNNAFQFNYFQIKGKKTTFYFCTGKTGTLYMALRGRYNTGTGSYYFIDYGGASTGYWGSPSSGSYITFPIEEGSTTISLKDEFTRQQIENATCTITLKLVDTEEYFDPEDELEYPHAKHNLFKVTTETGGNVGSYTILSLAGKNPTEIDDVISESCYIVTRCNSNSKSTYLEASDGYEVKGIYEGCSESKASVTKIKAPVNYTLKDVKVFRKWKDPNGNNNNSDTGNDNDENEPGNNTTTRMAVDLDLPSGTKWANMNLGATSMEGYGYYYAWGEVSGYDINISRTYSWANYKYSGNTYKSLTKYCTNSGYGTVDGRNILLTSDDAAFSGWGGSWRIPTTEDFEELYMNTTHTWTEINGVKGQEFTSKSNGKSIFIPASGYRNDTNHLAKNSSGYYWTNSIYQTSEPCYAHVFFFNSGKIENASPMYRCYGITIRPVAR